MSGCRTHITVAVFATLPRLNGRQVEANGTRIQPMIEMEHQLNYRWKNVNRYIVHVDQKSIVQKALLYTNR